MITTLTTRIESNYLLIEGVGSIENADEETKWADACYQEILKHNARRALVDQRQIEFKSSILDQCDVVSHYTENFEAKIRGVRIAILIKTKDKDLHDFWELYASNRGYPWKVFTEMDAATAFLKRFHTTISCGRRPKGCD